jgi:hypothetical protein
MSKLIDWLYRSRASMVSILVLAVFLVGCTHNQHRADAERAFYESQAQQERPPILELTAQPGETITLAGVQRLAVYSPAATDARIEQYRDVGNPWVQLADNLTQRGVIGFGVHELGRAIRTGFSEAGDRYEIGGNLGNTRGDTAGGNIGDTRRDTAGNDLIGRDRVDDRSVGRDQIGRDQRIGDEIDGSCIGAECRNVSPGPIDQSDNSDNSDNSGGGGDP